MSKRARTSAVQILGTSPPSTTSTPDDPGPPGLMNIEPIRRAGSLAGLLGAAGATAIGYALAEHVFNIRFTGNALVWLYGIVGGAVAVTLAGWLGTRSTVNEPPLTVLRQLG